LSQLPEDKGGVYGPISPNSNILESWTNARVTAVGEWVASASWATTPTLPIGDIALRPTEEPIEDPYLAEILGAIADEVARHLGAVCTGIASDFATRMSHAQKSLPRSQAAAAVQLARETARSELKTRQENARVQYRKAWMRKSWRDPSGGSPRR
jgi:hypothetical protein